MATIAAGSQGETTNAGRLALIVAGTVIVIWLAHVYSHAVAQSVEMDKRLAQGEFLAIARREWAIPGAAVAPVAMLTLGATEVLVEQTAIWLAFGLGLAMLAAQGARYAVTQRLGLAGTVATIAVNLVLGLAIVALEVILTH